MRRMFTTASLRALHSPAPVAPPMLIWDPTAPAAAVLAEMALVVRAAAQAAGTLVQGVTRRLTLVPLNLGGIASAPPLLVDCDRSQ